jgi:hypothetical protein
VHDIIDLEKRGIPGVFVASTEFEEAAASQASALGYDPALVLVPHPIQDRTDEELRVIANNAIEPILASISAEATH